MKNNFNKNGFSPEDFGFIWQDNVFIWYKSSKENGVIYIISFWKEYSTEEKYYKIEKHFADCYPVLLYEGKIRDNDFARDLFKHLRIL